MLQNFKLECKQIISSCAGAVAVYESLVTIKVQFWAIQADGVIRGIGIHEGNLTPLHTLPGFDCYR